MLRNWLPQSIAVPLWGNRRRWGLSIQPDDPCWREWLNTYADFYRINQRNGVGTLINDAGYQIMAEIDLTNKCVLEVGAGDIRHLRYLQGKPCEYVLTDISSRMMELAQQKLAEKNIVYRAILLERNQSLPLEDASVDAVVTFYSLEHLYPLRPYLDDLFRVLKPGGLLIGAIPTEGGLAWGIGRMFTSRRWLHNNTNINPDKIICWEHPNFADQIINELDHIFARKTIQYWPLPWLPVYDYNLVLRFCYQKNVA
ncbi:MAG: class I SAM-dependent methyltransferase [Negativicutes bacterium]|nr:class I SAM-dependent methyltransferase [Negativicutes bacterium]